ncbi:MAG: hypothetical protein ACK56K_11475, partial [Akkermansiaceae bacterium]
FVLLNLGFRGIETTTDLGWQLGASHLNAIRSQNLIGIFIPNAVLEGPFRTVPNGTGLSPISITEALHGKGFVAMARPCDLPHQNEFNDIPKSFGSRRDLSWLNEKPLNPVPFRTVPF